MTHKTMPRPLGPDHHPDDDFSMSEPTRAELVAEAAATFGEEAAAELARLLQVPFDIVLPEIQA